MKASDNPFPSVLFDEQGSDPSGLDTGTWRLYAKSGGIYVVDDADAVTGPLGGGGGDVATDSIWTTAGKVAVATGTATATEQWPPGHEFDYAEKTSTSTITQTTEAAADTVVAGNAVTYDGSTIVLIEFGAVYAQSSTNQFMRFWLYEDSGSIGQLGIVQGSAAIYTPVFMRRRMTPAAGSHTYTVKASTQGGTATVDGGAGGTGISMPAYIRIVKA